MTRRRKIFFPELASAAPRWAIYCRIGFWVFLAWYFLPFFTVNLLQFMETTPPFVHRVDLIFHEAGHIIFEIFGWPLLTWTGQNFVDCAPYINDARLLQLPLITGGTGREVEGHDWEFMLNELELIEYDGHIARWVLLIGRAIMALGFLWAAAAVYFQLRQAKDNGDNGGWTADDDQKLLNHVRR